MAELFPIAIAGAGLMGTWHARYAARCGATVAAVFDRDRDAAERLAAEFRGARAFTTLDELLEQCKPRVVHICTPADSHAGLAEIVLGSGTHLLIEKPLASNAEITGRLLASADARRLKLIPVHQFLFQAGFLKAWSSLPGLGQILHVDATFCSAGGEEFSGSQQDRIAADILPHPLALVERLSPGTLDAARWTLLRTAPGEWRATALAGALSLSLLITLGGRPTECSLRVITEGGVIDLDLFHGFATVDRAPVSRLAKISRPIRRSAASGSAAALNLGRRLLNWEPAYPGLRDLIRAFYASVRNDSAAPISAAEVLSVARARDRLIQAAGSAQ